ncbi:hypothetical protein KGF56_004726 [Candida oxycetoniae]|uniref:Uncharacterized protein n=1 Tax=Candida oxycetoniae TaxID=497107 RepID=A0AAI9SSS9_9ASCO|nr:uncharacterized protein KGF56_004726 [Candida oxycetoniae]KAI3402485.2 hypothetical protein KGF56_004726 [Candida oxycetoniae]
MVSILAIDSIVDNYESAIHQLKLPNLETLHLTGTIDTTTMSPYIAKYKLQLIQNSLINLLSTLNNSYKTNKSYNRIKAKLESVLIDQLDEKIYIVDQLIKMYDLKNTPIADPLEDHQSLGIPQQQPVIEEENLSELRERLLSTRKKDEKEEQDLDKLNTYHESIQDDILNELSQLTSSLKTSAMTFSSKILGSDLHILNETSENMIKNSNLFKVIDRNLNDYLENKTGNKISLWFLLKCVVIIACVFLIMIIFVAIVPRIR